MSEHPSRKRRAPICDGQILQDYSCGNEENRDEKRRDKKALGPNATQTVLKAELQTNYSRLESKFRNSIRSHDVYGNAEVPAALYPITDAKV